MPKRFVLCLAAFCAFVAQAQALTCADFQKAEARIRKAELKSEIAGALIDIGVAPADAQNLERTSPDEDVARIAALTYVVPRTKAVCSLE